VYESFRWLRFVQLRRICRRCSLRCGVAMPMPFYNVYGGRRITYLGGPSRTKTARDCEFRLVHVTGGDGFHAAVSGRSNTVYGESQLACSAL